MEMASLPRDRAVTVHFYDLRSAQAAVAEVRQQHVRQQGRIRNWGGARGAAAYDSGGGGRPMLVMPHYQQQQPIGGWGLIAGHAVWADFASRELDGPNQGSLIVFNWDPAASSASLAEIFQAFGESEPARRRVAQPLLSSLSSLALLTRRRRHRHRSLPLLIVIVKAQEERSAIDSHTERLRTCQEHIDREGRAQQSLVIAAPKYHKRYILPVSTSMPESGRQAMAAYQESNLYKTSTLQQEPHAVVCSSIKDRPPSFRKLRSLSTQRMRSSSPSLKERSAPPTPRPGNFSTAERKAISRPSSPFGRPGKYSDKRAASPLPTSSFARPGKFPTTDKRDVSPLPSSNPFARSGSYSIRANLLNSSSTRQRFPSEPQKSASMRLHAERNDKDIEQNSGKSRSFLKSLLTRRRSRKDEMLYNYLDEY